MLYLILALFFDLSQASVIGISTHPLHDEAKVLSAEMTGYMGQRHEMGMGLRYTQDVFEGNKGDVMAAGGQYSRALIAGAGYDMQILAEDLHQPRFSLKPYVQYLKYESSSDTLLGGAPILRKGFSVQGQEFFPYLGLPTGIKVDTSTDEFVYYASLSFGASVPIDQKLLVSIEGNKNMGASSDYLGALVSWIWN
jgi:hypothetical protein